MKESDPPKKVNKATAISWPLVMRPMVETVRRQGDQIILNSHVKAEELAKTGRACEKYS